MQAPRYATRVTASVLVATFIGCPADKRADDQAATSSVTTNATRPKISSVGPLAPTAAPDSFPRVALPGMSIEAPGHPAVTGNYSAGGAQTTSPFEWTVTWQGGPLPPVEALQSIAGGMLKAFDAQSSTPGRIANHRPVEVAGKGAHEFELVNGLGYTVMVTFAECGGRTIQILTGGLTGAKANSDKLVQSFLCTPDASQEAVRDAIAVDVRPGWQRTKPTGTPMLVNDRGVVVRPTSVAAPDRTTALETFLPAAARAGGFTIDSNTPTDVKGRKMWRGSVDVGGKAHPAAIVAWRCEDGRVGAVYIFGDPGTPLDDGVDLALTGRCLGPDEALPAYPLKKR